MKISTEKIKQLRVSIGDSQAEFAERLGVSLRSIANYESGDSKPRPKTVLKMLEIQKLVDEGNFHARSMQKKEPDAHWYGVPNVMMVPMVHHQARAGFMAGWADSAATTLEDFPKVPWEIDKEYKGRYVCFEVTGDSMNDESPEALLDGDVILCREVMQQHWQNRLHINQWDFVIAHRELGIVVKRITEHEVDTGRLVLHSLNEMYEDYEIYMQDCLAIFNVVDVKRSRRRR